MYKMLSTTVLAAGICAAGVAQAEELGKVISSTPVLQQVAVPRQVCTQEQVISEARQPSGAGAVVGAVVGGILGHTVGDGMGRIAATGVGAVAGAAIGDRLEGNRASEVNNVQRCTNQTFYENRVVAYNVVYEYGGKQFSVQMPQDPGPYVRLQITPVGGTAPQAAPVPTTYVAPAPVVATTVIERPVYVPAVAPAVVPVVYSVGGYYGRPVHPASRVGISVNIGYGGRYTGHPGRWDRGRHWR